jgi:Cu2+-containing amine oxidase
MSYTRTLSLTVWTILMGLIGFAAGPSETQKKDVPPPQPAKEITHSFPSKEAMKTAWKVQWETENGYGLFIRNAWFKRGPKDAWMQVLGDARLSEMFVPYHSGSPRFWDISYNFGLLTLTKDEAGPHGKLLGDPPTVVQEVRDRGLMWIHPRLGSRRGEKLLLWGVLDAANYRYIIEYGFQDDGVITFRAGSTGRNYSTREFEGHMHNALWRVDINLDGPANNSVYVVEHIEPDSEGVKAKTVERPFNKGVEGFEDWNAAKFTTLNITNDKKKNARKMPISYDVVPMRMGNARHFGPEEECTQHDFWVTVNRENELDYPKVHEYAKKKEKIMNADVVLWHSTPGHHNPRSEDGRMQDDFLVGATPVMWTGFDLRPRNVFDGTPHFDYEEKK